MVYECEIDAPPGKFLPQKAIELGVPRGPLFGRLKQGQPVTLENGRVVHPKDVLEHQDLGPQFLIVDCPNAEVAAMVVKHPALTRHHRESEDRAFIIIHMCPKKVAELDFYQEWVAKFPKESTHVFLGAGLASQTTIFASGATHQVIFCVFGC